MLMLRGHGRTAKRRDGKIGAGIEEVRWRRKGMAKSGTDAEVAGWGSARKWQRRSSLFGSLKKRRYLSQKRLFFLRVRFFAVRINVNS